MNFSKVEVGEMFEHHGQLWRRIEEFSYRDQNNRKRRCNAVRLLGNATYGRFFQPSERVSKPR